MAVADAGYLDAENHATDQDSHADFAAKLVRLLPLPPDPRAAFPRSNWGGTVFADPPFRPVVDDCIQLAWAGRKASKMWAETQGGVDENGFLLAVADKAFELHNHERRNSYVNSTVGRRPSTVAEWRSVMEPLIDEALDMALKAARETGYGDSHPPRNVVVGFVRAALDARYRRLIDSFEVMQQKDRRPLDLSRLAGYVDPQPNLYVPKWRYPVMEPGAAAKLIAVRKEEALAAAWVQPAVEEEAEIEAPPPTRARPRTSNGSASSASHGIAPQTPSSSSLVLSSPSAPKQPPLPVSDDVSDML